jgi:hypothetical protein
MRHCPGYCPTEMLFPRFVLDSAADGGNAAVGAAPARAHLIPRLAAFPRLNRRHVNAFIEYNVSGSGLIGRLHYLQP